MPANNKKIVKQFAKAIVLHSFRNGLIEDIHAGKSPVSITGDFSDVRVVTPLGEIAWTEVSRISQEEMKVMMKEAVDRVYTILLSMNEQDQVFLSNMLRYANGSTSHWDTPQKSKALSGLSKVANSLFEQ